MSGAKQLLHLLRIYIPWSPLTQLKACFSLEAINIDLITPFSCCNKMPNNSNLKKEGPSK